MNYLLNFLAFPLAAYLVASIPFGVIIARAHGVDLRKAGSGNVGATNVARVIGRRWGILCFFLDVLKGLLPVLAMGFYLHRAQAGRPGDAVPDLSEQAAWLTVCLACIFGHIFSLFLGFRGGKGVATSLGVLLGVYPYYTLPGLAGFGLWIVTVLIWRYVSLSSIIASATFPLLFVGNCLLTGRRVGDLWPLLAFAIAMAALIVIRHRSNISRLLAGTEGKILQKPAATAGQSSES